MSHMTWYPIGESSYPDLKGQMQYVNSERIAQQWLSLVRDFWARFGERLSPNEGRRPRARQTALYANYLRTGYPKAALPFTSRHDEVTHGNAIDAGVTMANGGNRALTAAEFDWYHQQCELRGFTWTGRYFNEPWHIEGATRLEHFPPYPGITVDNAVQKPTAPPIVKPKPTPVGDVVNTEIVPIDNNKGGIDMYLVNAETMKCMHLQSSAQVRFWKARSVKQYVQDTQARSILANFERVEGKGAI